MSIKNVADIYPLSPMQQGMLFHSLFAPESGVYIEQMVCTLRGDLDIDEFHQAWQRVLDRHTILRTGFLSEGVKEPVQFVQRQAKLPFQFFDLQHESAEEQKTWLDDFANRERARGFDLTKAPLMRLALLQTSPETHEFVWTYHHILLDGWSLPLLLRDVFTLYEALRMGIEPPLPASPPFRNYISWLKKQDTLTAERFWQKTLRGMQAPTPFIVDRSVETEAEGPEIFGEQEIWLSKAATGALHNLVRQHHLTLSTLVQGVWAILLNRYSGEENICFGATVSGRPPDLPRSEEMLGLFINTLPVRVRVDEDLPVFDWMKGLQEQLLEMRQYEYSSLVDIQRWSEMPPGVPLFENIVVFENYPVQPALQSQKGSLIIENVRSFEQTNYPLNLIAGAAGELMIKFVYNQQRFEDETIQRMLGHFQSLINGILRDSHQMIAQLPLLTSEEQHQIRITWGEQEADFNHQVCLHCRFEKQVQRSPEAAALHFKNQTLTYQELNNRANQLAHYLQKAGVTVETLVGISIEPSPEMIIAVLGVLKAGGAFVPIDSTYPEERLAFMLNDSGVSILLTQERLIDHLPWNDLNIQLITLDVDWTKINQMPMENPATQVQPDNLAYMIYTSGSTGQPKAALLPHQGVSNFILGCTTGMQIGADCRFLKFAAFSFDASIIEIFAPLFVGGTVVLADRDVLQSVPDLHKLLKEKGITHAILPPSLLRLLSPENLSDLETLISGGESCSREIAERWAAGRTMFNAYGPTETSVGPTYYRIDKIPNGTATIPIGRPLPNLNIHLLDSRGRLVPIGVPGEICIGGIGVGRGYLNRPKLTAEKFVPDPYAKKPGARWYRSGDLGRYLPNGNIEFLGRIDHQVKMRGFRIELGEIEAVLEGHAAVRQAVVVTREGQSGDTAFRDDKQLVAYLVFKDEEAPSTRELRVHLRKKLPDYMIPAFFVALPELPLLPNGKINRKALPAPEMDRSKLEAGYVAPRTGLELKLAQIWEDVLGIKPIGIGDNFFELGGHSLLAVRLAGQIQKQLDIQISLAALFQNPTIEALARILENSGAEQAPSLLVPIQPRGTKPPVFFVHPSGGSVHWYTDLAKQLGSDQPFYGIQALGTNGEPEIDSRIEEMAARYVQEIRTQQSEGPYFLGSWSMGVIVAFEIAQQLWAQGEEVAWLGLLDQGPVLQTEPPEDEAAYLVGVFGKHLPLSVDQLRGLTFDEQIAHVLEVGQRQRWIFPEVTLAQFSQFVKILKTHTEAWRQYTPRPYPGKITLFVSDDEEVKISLSDRWQSLVAKIIPGRIGPNSTDQKAEVNVQAEDMGWGDLARGGVEVYYTPGDHISMIHKPHVKQLAERLKVSLEAVTLKEKGTET